MTTQHQQQLHSNSGGVSNINDDLISTTVTIPKQIRPLRMEPDPNEPPFSYEEQLMQQSDDDHLNEDDFEFLNNRTMVKSKQRHSGGHSNSYSSQELNYSNMEMKPTLRSSHINKNNGGDGPAGNSNYTLPNSSKQHNNSNSIAQIHDAVCPISSLLVYMH